MKNVSLKKCAKGIVAQCMVLLLIMAMLVVPTVSVSAAVSTNTTWDFFPYTDWAQSANLPSIINTEDFPGLVASGVNSSSETWVVENGALEVVGSGRLIIKTAYNSPFTATFSDSSSGLRPTVMVSTTANGPWTTVEPTYTTDTNGITLSVDDIGDDNCYVQYLISGTSWSNYWNHKLYSISFNKYVDTINCPNGVTVDKPEAVSGDVVTVTIADNTSIKAASLMVYDGDGDEVTINRLGFREDGTANQFTFIMPAVKPVKITFEKIDYASQTNANIGGLGTQLRLAEDDTNGAYDGVRFGSQFRYDTANGTFTISGTTYTFKSCGTLITRSEILEYLCGDTAKEDYFTLEGWDTGKNAKYLIDIPQTRLYDKCDEYIEFVGGIAGINSKHYDYEFAGRGYVIAEADGKEYTFYTDIMTAKPSEIMTKALDTKVVFNKQINTKYYDFRQCDSVTNGEFYGGATRGVFPTVMPYTGDQPSVTMRVGKNTPVVVCYTSTSGYTKTPGYYVSADKKTWTAVTPDVLDKAANGDTRATFNSIGSDNMFFRFEFPQTSSDTTWSLTLQSISYNSIGGSVELSVTHEALFWVRVGDNCYCDESNGIMRSMSELHRVKVPMKELDEIKQYTVCVRPLIERLPYFSKTDEVKEFTFSFYPVPEKGARLYHMADAHDRIDQPVSAAKHFGDIDLLILNGDIISDSGDPARFHNIYEICSQLTAGEHPVVFSRGNHDMRGGYAERFADYTPNHNGNTYYTFRAGNIWGIVLDCGEDKPDDHPEYSYTVSCGAFRRRQTEFIKDVILRADEEYAASDITTRLIISHHPFTYKIHPPFDIEGEVYTEWAELLKEYVKPNLMLNGHLHDIDIWYPGCKNDIYGQPCPLILGSALGERTHTGCGIVLNTDYADVVFVDSDGNMSPKYTVNMKGE